MKRIVSILALLTLSLALLAGCGSSGTGGSSAEEGSGTVDLNAFFQSLETKYQWGEDYFMDLDDETLAATYPGLEEFTFKQKVAKMPMMTAAVNEFVFLECESADDTAAVGQILKTRVETQRDGGAWYPESMAAWGEAHVLITDQYVALIASSEYQDQIESAWNHQFGK